MDAPFGKKISAGDGGGIHGRNKAPFDKPQDLGNGGISTKFYDSMSARSASTVTAGAVSPPIGSTQTVGQRRFKR